MTQARVSADPGRFNLFAVLLTVFGFVAASCGAGTVPTNSGAAAVPGSNPVAATTVAPTGGVAAPTSTAPIGTVEDRPIGTVPGSDPDAGSAGPDGSGAAMVGAIVEGAVDTVGERVEPLDDPSVDSDSDPGDEVGSPPASVSVLGVSGWSVTDALASDADCAQPVTGRALVIGYAADLGGQGETFDRAGVAAAEHLAKLINCSGGLDGMPVRVVVADVSGSPTTSRDAVEELLAAGAEALIGPRYVDPGLRVLQAAGGRVPVVFATSTEPVLASPVDLGFLVGVDDDAAAVAAAIFAREQRWTLAATLSASGPRHRAAPARFAVGFAERGGEVVGDVEYVVDETVDFAAQAEELTLMDPVPEVVYTTMPLDQVALLRAALDADGLSAMAVVTESGLDPVMASAGPIRLAVDGLDPSDLDGVYVIVQAAFGPGKRPSQFDGSVVIATGARSTNPAAAALVADAMVLIGDASLRTGERGADSIGQAMLQTDGLKAVSGVLRYGGRASPAKTVTVMRLVDGGPTEVATIAAGR